MIKIDAGEIDTRRIGWRDGAGFVPTDMPANGVSNLGPVEAMRKLAVAMQKAVRHFPFHRNGTLYCDCGWSLVNGGKLDWWAHVEEAEA